MKVRLGRPTLTKAAILKCVLAIFPDSLFLLFDGGDLGMRDPGSYHHAGLAVTGSTRFPSQAHWSLQSQIFVKMRLCWW